MSEQVVKFKVQQIAVRLSPQALATFDAHRQRRFYHREAGGQLFARVRGNDWEIVAATGPRSRDRRGRFSFRPHRASEQEEIFRHHELGLDYVGDWHTHPEDVPTPSSDDLSSIAELVRRSTHHLPGFLLVIVGRQHFPKGLWASFHSVDGTSTGASRMRLESGIDPASDAPDAG
ncbi:integrative and conjugative element protein (TIGR02256 family) [Bradyrhizobium diazoefficiens]